jgi:hypothetical protein
MRVSDVRADGEAPVGYGGGGGADGAHRPAGRPRPLCPAARAGGAAERLGAQHRAAAGCCGECDTEHPEGVHGAQGRHWRRLASRH